MSSWERRGENARLRTQTQRDLDTKLQRADRDARERFFATLTLASAGQSARVRAINNEHGFHEADAAGRVNDGLRSTDLTEWVNADGESQEVNRRDVLVVAGVAAAVALPSPAVEAIAGGLTSHHASCHLTKWSYSALAAAASRVKRAYHAGDYQRALDDLSDLLDGTRTAPDGDLGSEAQRVAADIYQTACSVLLKLGEPGLALLAADRSTAAASRSGDPVVVAASARALAHALASNGHSRRAVGTALAGAQRLDQARVSTPTALAVYGALLLRASILAAGGEDRSTALGLLTEAEDVAGRLDGSDNINGTYFCVQNVQLHRVSVAVRLGDAGQAVAHARQIDPACIRLGERRASYFLDLAGAFTQWGKHHQAYEALCAAERAAPQEVALRPASHELIAELQHRCPPSLYRPLQQLTDRIGVPA